jgi:hypothetical protein
MKEVKPLSAFFHPSSLIPHPFYPVVAIPSQARREANAARRCRDLAAGFSRLA